MPVYQLEIPAKERSVLAKRWGVTGQSVYNWLCDKPVAGKRRMLDLALKGMSVAPNRTPIENLRNECEKRGMYLYQFYQIMAAGTQTKIKCSDPERVSLIHDVLRGIDIVGVDKVLAELPCA